MSKELTDETMKYINSAPIEKRKKLGQYMTPRFVRDIAIKNLPLNDGDNVLDPAVGTGELLLAVLDKNPNINVHGWDIDDKILKTAKANLKGRAVTLECKNGLLPLPQEVEFDAIIMNPPYFELKPSEEEKELYGDVIKGRANIYAFFIKKAIDLVKNNGYISIIVPPSMNSGAYFENLREYILTHTEIKFMKIINDSSLFTEAQTSVQIMTLQKKENPKLNAKYVLNIGALTDAPSGKYVFVEDASKIKKMWINKKSVYNLGYDVVTGPLIWNVFAKDLSAKKMNNDYVTVYYSKDISSADGVVYNAVMDKRRYMDKLKKAPLKGEAIIVNRIVGGVGVGKIKAALVSGEYYAENHVNVITARTDVKPKITLAELHKRIINDSEISDYLQAFTGNTQLSASELKYFVPIKLSK